VKKRIDFFNESDIPVPRAENLIRICNRILVQEGTEGQVNVVFTGDSSIRELNRQFRKKDKTTDVLSFEWHDEELLGEIYISMPQVKRQAPRYDNTFYRELKRVLIHGVLHLCGFDHLTPSERKTMRAREDFYM